LEHRPNCLDVGLVGNNKQIEKKETKKKKKTEKLDEKERNDPLSFDINENAVIYGLESAAGKMLNGTEVKIITKLNPEGRYGCLMEDNTQKKMIKVSNLAKLEPKKVGKKKEKKSSKHKKKAGAKKTTANKKTALEPCPICQAELVHLNEADKNIHVNYCVDNPSSLNTQQQEQSGQQTLAGSNQNMSSFTICKICKLSKDCINCSRCGDRSQCSSCNEIVETISGESDQDLLDFRMKNCLLCSSSICRSCNVDPECTDSNCTLCKWIMQCPRCDIGVCVNCVPHHGTECKQKPKVKTNKPKPNDKCPCGSLKKFKKCCKKYMGNISQNMKKQHFATYTNGKKYNKT